MWEGEAQFAGGNGEPPHPEMDWAQRGPRRYITVPGSFLPWGMPALPVNFGHQ